MSNKLSINASRLNMFDSFTDVRNLKRFQTGQGKSEGNIDHRENC